MSRNPQTAGLAAALAAGAVLPVLAVVSVPYADYFDVRDVVGLILFWTLASFVALLHLALAAPLYLFLRARGRVSWGTAALSGLVIGAIPLPLISLAFLGGALEHGLLNVVALLGLGGLVGGLTFRAVLGKPA